eukprot:NODE_890_length_3403_cov_0.243039.p3 type:complete len:116 gc:universal NODE_890_length_3403_cov_0.243039:1200-853(-)
MLYLQVKNYLKNLYGISNPKYDREILRKTCYHEMKCNVRKYCNKFEGHEIFYPVPEEFFTKPKGVLKTNNNIQVPDLSMESFTTRSNLSELPVKNYKSCSNMWKKFGLKSHYRVY